MTKVVWYTGLPCSGKTTNARKLTSIIQEAEGRVEHMDGDIIRSTPLGRQTGFTSEDRAEHILKMGQIAKMLVDHDVWVICSFVSPSVEIREEIKEKVGKEKFFEIFMKASVDDMVKRDTKGMYKLAREGKIENFTGISADYEEPPEPDLILDGVKNTLDYNVNKVCNALGLPHTAYNPHMVFVGRWCPLHKGHVQIIKEKLAEEERPVLILVRETTYDEVPAQVRAEMVEAWMDAENVTGKVMVIPDITGVYYGRKVGYEVEQVGVTEDIRTISGTEIRKMIREGNPGWREIVAPGVAEFIERNGLFGWKENLPLYL